MLIKDFRGMGIIQEMRRVCQPRKLNDKGKLVLTGHWYNKYFIRYFSIYLTWFCVKLGVSANAVSVMMIVAGLAGTVLCIPHVLWMTILGVFALMVFEVLDCVDGEVARWNKNSSLKGLYLDLISHVLCNPLAGAICALHLYAWTGEVRFLFIAFVTYVATASEHGIRKSQQRIRYIMSKKKDATPEFSYRGQKHGLMANICHWLKVGLNCSLETFSIKLVMLPLIFIGYAANDTPMRVFCWIFAVYTPLAVIIRILLHYFLSLPDLPHEKSL